MSKLTRALHLRRKTANRSPFGNFLVILLLALMCFCMVIPLYYAIVSSLKPFEELFVFPPKFYVVSPTLQNFRDLFIIFANSAVPFTRYIFNSLFVSVTATVLHILLSSMAAYPLAKNEFRGKKVLFSLIMLALLFTAQVTFLPQYIIIARLGWINTYLAVICPFLGSSLGLFLMKQFMEVIPLSLIEAARIDGAREMRIWLQIVMPNVKPAWLTLTIFTFQAAWNSTGSSFIFDEELKMLPVAIAQIVAGSSVARMGVAMASTVFLMLPPIVLFVASQSQVIQTMAHAGIKE